MKSAAAIVASVLVATSSSAHAAPDSERAAHVLHVELATLVAANGLSLNYEHHFVPSFALRVGYSLSGTWAPAAESRSGHGPLLSLTFLHGDYHRLEVSGGVAVVKSDDEVPLSSALGDGWNLSPVAFVGYRRQAAAGGVIYRLGMGLGGGYGAGVVIGMGGAF